MMPVLRVPLVGLALSFAAPAAAQTIVPVEWPRPVYPQIAQAARVEGDVEVAVDVRPDGTVADVQVVAGSPLLQGALVDAARRTRFECRACSTPLTRYSLYATFRLVPPGGDKPKAPPLVVSPTQGWVTVAATPVVPKVIACYVAHKVRAPMCLYLWRCRAVPGRCVSYLQ